MIKKMLFAGLLFLDTTAPRQECSALQLKQRRTPIIKATMLPVLCWSQKSQTVWSKGTCRGCLVTEAGFLKSNSFERN